MVEPIVRVGQHIEAVLYEGLVAEIVRPGERRSDQRMVHTSASKRAHFGKEREGGKTKKIKDKKSKGKKPLLDHGSFTKSQKRNPPFVSCICPTYNRPPDQQHLLEEAIECFLRQTYPNKELVVLNDCPEQELVCDAPGVRVVNVSERFPTLGDKRNAAVALARGDLIAPWDDDDISLPWRLSLSVKGLGNTSYFNPRRYWFWDRDGLRSDHPVAHAHLVSLFRRSAFEAVGGYPSISFAEDEHIHHALLSSVACTVPDPGRENLARRDWYYIYRWAISPVHMCSRATDEWYRELGMLPVQQGRFHLFPHWRKDYVADIARWLDADAGETVASRGIGFS
jgi:hypothetical protein